MTHARSCHRSGGVLCLDARVLSVAVADCWLQLRAFFALPGGIVVNNGLWLQIRCRFVLAVPWFRRSGTRYVERSKRVGGCCDRGLSISTLFRVHCVFSVAGSGVAGPSVVYISIRLWGGGQKY